MCPAAFLSSQPSIILAGRSPVNVPHGECNRVASVQLQPIWDVRTGGGSWRGRSLAGGACGRNVGPWPRVSLAAAASNRGSEWRIEGGLCSEVRRGILCYRTGEVQPVQYLMCVVLVMYITVMGISWFVCGGGW